MADLDNIKDLNVRLLFKGKGALDAKSVADTYVDMEAVVNKYFDYFETGDLFWVKDEEAFYVLTLVGTDHFVYNKKNFGGGSVGGSGNMQYGGDEDIYRFLVVNDQSYKPSALGYGDGDVIITTGEYYPEWNVWEVSIQGAVDTYIDTGKSLAGTDGGKGPKGDDGEKGEKGEPFKVDAQGPEADRHLYCDEVEGFSYFSTDTALLYFKTSVAFANPCTWTVGIAFGKGAPGKTTFNVYLWHGIDPDSAVPPTRPQTGSSNVPAGWYDSPGDATADQTNEIYLWVSTSMYTADSSGDPISGDIPSWSFPTQINGDGGIDGLEGTSAGFWAVWSDKKVPAATTIPPPIKDIHGEDSWAPGAATDWVDDIDQIPDYAAIWMATSLYNTTDKTWGAWARSKVAGEEPPYKLNLFKRFIGDTPPAAPTQSVVIEYTQADGTFTTGAEAAALVGDSWEDAPPPPVQIGVDHLYFTELSVRHDGVDNNKWSAPVQIDGKEGRDAGIFTIWSDSATLRPEAEDPNNIISGDTIDLTASPGWYDDIVAGSGSDAVWMSTTMWRLINSVWKWSPWKTTKVKGEDGLPGGDGQPGKSGGTIIMFAMSPDLNETEPERPPNNFDPVVNLNDLENSSWIVNVTNASAVYLAVMTFGQTEDFPLGVWSNWRVSKIQGDDGIEGISIPPGALMFAGEWGSEVPYAWSIVSNSQLQVLDGFIDSTKGGKFTTGEVMLLPLMRFMGSRAYPEDVKTGAKEVLRYGETGGELVITHTPYQYAESISEFIKIKPISFIYNLISTLDLGTNTLEYKASGSTSSAIFSGSISGILSRLIGTRRFSYFRTEAVTIASWGQHASFSPVGTVSEETGIALLYTENYSGADNEITATWFEMHQGKLWLCFGYPSGNPLPSSARRTIITRTEGLFGDASEYAVHSILTEPVIPPPPLPGSTTITAVHNPGERTIDVTFSAATGADTYIIKWEWIFNGTSEKASTPDKTSEGTYTLHLKGQALPSGTEVYITVTPCNTAGCRYQQPYTLTI